MSFASGFHWECPISRADEASTTTSPATETVSDANTAANPKSAGEEKNWRQIVQGGSFKSKLRQLVLADQAPASAGSEAAGQDAKGNRCFR